MRFDEKVFKMFNGLADIKGKITRQLEKSEYLIDAPKKLLEKLTDEGMKTFSEDKPYPIGYFAFHMDVEDNDARIILNNLPGVKPAYGKEKKFLGYMIDNRDELLEFLGGYLDRKLKLSVDTPGVKPLRDPETGITMGYRITDYTKFFEFLLEPQTPSSKK